MFFETQCFELLLGDEELVSHILDEDSSHCNVTSKDGATPLMIAAMLGHVKIAELLIHKGADVNHKESKSGWTALMQATFHRYVKPTVYIPGMPYMDKDLTTNLYLINQTNT